MTQAERFSGCTNALSPSANSRADNSGPVLGQARRLAEQLQAALSRLATIDQAIGILISRGGGSAEEAIAALRDVSRAHDTDLGTVARRIVQQVSRQAQTRNAQRPVDPEPLAAPEG